MRFQIFRHHFGGNAICPCSRPTMHLPKKRRMLWAARLINFWGEEQHLCGIPGGSVDAPEPQQIQVSRPKDKKVTTHNIDLTGSADVKCSTLWVKKNMVLIAKKPLGKIDRGRSLTIADGIPEFEGFVNDETRFTVSNARISRFQIVTKIIMTKRPFFPQ